MSEEQFKHWRINQGGQALLDAMNSGEISASLFAKQVWQAALSSERISASYAKSVPLVYARNPDIEYLTTKKARGERADIIMTFQLVADDVYSAPLYPAPQAPTDDERVRELEKAVWVLKQIANLDPKNSGLIGTAVFMAKEALASMSGEQK